MPTNTPPSKARILVVDDHPVVRDGLVAQIAAQRDLEVCGEAEDVAGALAVFERTRPDIAVIDASWHLPAAKRDARAEFLAARIPGAQFFDIDEISDSATPLPHMLPRPEKFSSRMKRLGIGDGKKVIAYDTAGLFSAARAWWMFRIFGHDDVAVLDGGFPKWKAEGRPIDQEPPGQPQERHFSARFQSMMVRDKNDVLRAVKTGKAQVADARSPGRFTGAEPEPRRWRARGWAWRNASAASARRRRPTF